MATGLGTATIDFGAFPGSNEASVSVTGQTGISGTSKAEAYVMADDTTSDHTASGGAAVIDGSVGTSGADLILNTTTISIGVAVSVTGFTITRGNP